MGRKRQPDQTRIEATFRELDEEYRDNEKDNPIVSALNLLPADERAFVISYIVHNTNKMSLARALGCSRTLIAYKLKDITDKLTRYLNNQDNDLY